MNVKVLGNLSAIDQHVQENNAKLVCIFDVRWNTQIFLLLPFYKLFWYSLLQLKQANYLHLYITKNI